jgi:ABC-2 type transport system permease protein
MNTPTSTMKWLIRRELWEHKGAFFWAPLAVAAVLVLLFGGGFVYAMIANPSLQVHVGGNEVMAVNGFPPPMLAKMASAAASSYLVITAPLFLVLPVVVFFYCMASLYDDRRDRSILFWKSLPISDSQTVLSKAVTALVVAPLTTIAIGIGAALVLVVIGLLGGAIKGINLIAPLLANIDFYLSPIYLLSFLPLYILWALPTVGWLLLVSSWAKSRVFLWAVGVPLVALALLAWFDFLIGRFSGLTLNVRWFGEEIVARVLLGVFPGVWFGEADGAALAQQNAGLDGPLLLGTSYATLLTPGVWIAAAAGCAMIYGAIRMRRWRDEG